MPVQFFNISKKLFLFVLFSKSSFPFLILSKFPTMTAEKNMIQNITRCIVNVMMTIYNMMLLVFRQS